MYPKIILSPIQSFIVEDVSIDAVYVLPLEGNVLAKHIEVDSLNRTIKISSTNSRYPNIKSEIAP